MRLLGKAFLVLVLFSSCHQPPPVISEARQYYRQAFDSIHKYSLRRKQLNHDSVESYFFRELHDTMPLRYAYHYLREAVMAIDRHSDFYRPALVRIKGRRPDDLYTFRGRMLQNRYAYIEIRGCQALDSASCKSYADSLATTLQTFYEEKPVGWIIDLRGNTGGNMYPMLAGLAGLLGEGILGYHVFPDGKRKAWYVANRDPNSGVLKASELLDSLNFYSGDLPIAILCGPQTASAGEGLLLSFRGDERVRVIGRPTHGMSTSNRMVFMPDSAVINITTSVMADRNGKSFDRPIPPDEEVDDPVKLFSRAYFWIEKAKLQPRANVR